jgi:hypothetical protein
MKEGNAEKIPPHEYGYDTEWKMSLYLGSVMSLMPSGKYYTAWANSNVTEGEANKGAAEWERMESAASELGAWIESGEGDPTDAFLCWNCPPFKPSERVKYLLSRMENYRDIARVSKPEDLSDSSIGSCAMYQEYLSDVLSEIGLLD